MHVQFDGAKKEKIISYFCCPQNPDVYEYLGEVDASDKIYKDYYNSLPVIDRIGMPSPE